MTRKERIIRKAAKDRADFLEHQNRLTWADDIREALANTEDTGGEIEYCEWIDVDNYYRWSCRPEMKPQPMPLFARFCPGCGKQIGLSTEPDTHEELEKDVMINCYACKKDHKKWDHTIKLLRALYPTPKDPVESNNMIRIRICDTCVRQNLKQSKISYDGVMEALGCAYTPHIMIYKNGQLETDSCPDYRRNKR